jgi:hypothetical protein
MMIQACVEIENTGKKQRDEAITLALVRQLPKKDQNILLTYLHSGDGTHVDCAAVLALHVISTIRRGR